MGNNAIEDEALGRMTKLVNYLISRADSGPFREPVDFRGLGLWDYPKVIDKPMDLGTVKRKLERNKYKNANECAEDIRQIWTNCKTYNADESDFYLLAESFSKKFEERFSKIEADCDEEGKKRATALGSNLDAKAKFAKNLYRLSGMELGHVLHVLDIRSPAALEQPDPSAKAPLDRFTEEAEVEINVDAIDARTFAELDRYVKDKMKARSNGMSETPDEEQVGGAKKKQRR
mmetsp:Transcript_6384/g.7912  ORF Transcript_6384/g.7912 Transcript_6384/m.7912 type:complete len:232 (+) Transcript_6384:50-745(+)